jgi:hypothetical protein
LLILLISVAEVDVNKDIEGEIFGLPALVGSDFDLRKVGGEQPNLPKLVQVLNTYLLCWWQGQLEKTGFTIRIFSVKIFKFNCVFSVSMLDALN